MSYLAIDIGASSGRHMLGKRVNGKIELKEIYRFKNKTGASHSALPQHFYYTTVLPRL